MRTPFLALAIAASGLAATAGTGQTTTTDKDHQPAGTAGMQRPPASGPIKRADANHDGVITRAEAIADAEARFAAMDTNTDGKLTPEEREAAHEAMRARFRELRQADGDAPPPPRPPREHGAGSDRDGGRSGLPDGRPDIEPRGGFGSPGERNRDGDGVITRGAFIARATERFDRMDANHDGRLDQEELASFGPGSGRHGRRSDHGPHGESDMSPPAPPPADAQ